MFDVLEHLSGVADDRDLSISQLGLRLYGAPSNMAVIELTQCDIFSFHVVINRGKVTEIPLQVPKNLVSQGPERIFAFVLHFLCESWMLTSLGLPEELIVFTEKEYLDLAKLEKPSELLQEELDKFKSVRICRHAISKWIDRYLGRAAGESG